ncbi:MAG: arsenosugar biosynthesis radical SAM protein ArsS [Candidatus Pelagadaptatus aseana]|uniref:arsenosugar biosynthesis radical SAM (seleno)protein ArsS n=1 Tax=Candidatus Pelagadaptatus aseana TaxID=3120508 RepID=UPI0039B145C4
MRDTEPLLRSSDFPRLRRDRLTALQVNLGYLCNLSCTHCHVNAGPKRTELMDKTTIDLVLEFIDRQGIRSLDLTGGAPEMNPHFQYLVAEARKRGCEVIDRCNLTVLLEPGYEGMADFLAQQQVRIVASLPCYEEDNVNQQRGKGVYQASIEALQRLNALGYGRDSELVLDLVYNPGGPFLPPPQEQLQKDYKQQLAQRYDIIFHELLTITNMPISRFGSVLLAHDQFDDYLTLLKNNYSADNMSSVMCRSLLSVDWQGHVYDCDFNQMLHWPMQLTEVDQLIASDSRRIHLRDLMERDLEGMPIVVGEHCYGCTAGQGSSCGGALSA